MYTAHFMSVCSDVNVVFYIKSGKTKKEKQIMAKCNMYAQRTCGCDVW